jgi:hypothetical protein
LPELAGHCRTVTEAGRVVPHMHATVSPRLETVTPAWLMTTVLLVAL